MNYTLHEYLNLALRWFHIFAGILWIGATWYFTWLDRRFHTSDPDEVWMVHSGGFYRVQKLKSPSANHNLHWFKWEAALTWFSGVALLIVVYYLGGLMVGGRLSSGKAIVLGLAVMPIGWLIYDHILARNNMLAMIGGWLAIVAVAYGLKQVMPDRAAFFHVGAILGTLMTVNVWNRIIPAQKELVRAAREGGQPDQKLADVAKTRSKHNTFMIMPVLLIMVSSHFPVTTYSHAYSWAILGVLTLVGWGAAHIVRNQ